MDRSLQMVKDVKTISLHVNVHLKLTSTNEFNNQIDRGTIPWTVNFFPQPYIIAHWTNGQGLHGDNDEPYSWYQKHKFLFSKDGLTTA